MDDVRKRITEEAEELERRWARDPRWAGVERPYAAEDVIRLRGSLPQEHTLARHGAERLWDLLHSEDHVAALGCLTGGQAVECVKAGSAGDLPLRVAGRRGCEPRRRDVSGPIAVSRQLRADGGPQDQQRAAES